MFSAMIAVSVASGIVAHISNGSLFGHKEAWKAWVVMLSILGAYHVGRIAG